MNYLTVCLNPTIQQTLVLKTLLAGEVNRALEAYSDAGGKGVHVSRVLGQLGHAVTHLTFQGGRTGEVLCDLAQGEPFVLRAVPAKAPVRYCYTLIARETGEVTEVVEEGHPVTAEDETGVRRQFLADLAKHEALVITGTKAPGFSDALYPWMVGEARGRGVPVLLDFRGGDLRSCLPLRPTVIKPNLQEFAGTFAGVSLVGPERPPEVIAQVEREMLAMAADFGTAVVLTDGGGPVRFTEGGRVWQASPPPVKAVNPIGSGDAFAAGLASALFGGAPLGEAVQEGIRCGGLNAALLRPGRIV